MDLVGSAVIKGIIPLSDRRSFKRAITVDLPTPLGPSMVRKKPFVGGAIIVA